MDFRKIRILAISITLGVSLVLLIFHYSYALGFLLGGLSSIIGFEIITLTVNKSKIESLKKWLIISRILRMIMYGSFITLGILFGDVINLVAMVIAFMVVKLSIILLDKFKKKGG